MFAGVVQRIYYYSFGTKDSNAVPGNLQETLQEAALRRCNVKLRSKLDLTEITPHLRQRNLLTESDVYTLKSKPPSEAVDHLISILPKKKDGWWGELIASLKNSTTGTAHDDMANMLEAELHRLKSSDSDADGSLTYTADESNDEQPSEYRQGKRPSVHEALGDLNEALSGITRAICTLGENPFLFTARPNIEDATVDPKKLKDELEEVKYKYKVMVNQVKLINLQELLIEKSTAFNSALSEVLRLYTDHFKSKKSTTHSFLSQHDLKMIKKIIEDVTECTENIDMDEEQKSWKQCLANMNEQLLHLRKVLYSIDTNEMVKLQEAWSLKGDEEEKARKWIDERRKVIEAGKNCLIKLNEICSKEDEVSDVAKNVLRAVQNRIKVGEGCFTAWINWIDHRTNLSK